MKYLTVAELMQSPRGCVCVADCHPGPHWVSMDKIYYGQSTEALERAAEYVAKEDPFRDPSAYLHIKMNIDLLWIAFAEIERGRLHDLSGAMERLGIEWWPGSDAVHTELHERRRKAFDAIDATMERWRGTAAERMAEGADQQRRAPESDKGGKLAKIPVKKQRQDPLRSGDPGARKTDAPPSLFSMEGL